MLTQKYIIYDQYLDRLDSLKPLTLKNKHKVQIVCVLNPVEFHLHLIDKLPDLLDLNDQLNNCYFGIGASNYEMPLSYVNVNRLCAAIYVYDSNWYRCRITSVLTVTNQVVVEFIDYGNELLVKSNGLKFLKKEFGSLPISFSM